MYPSKKCQSWLSAGSVGPERDMLRSLGWCRGEDSGWLQELVSNLPGVNPQSEVIQEALGAAAAASKDDKDEKKKKADDKKDDKGKK